MTPEQYQAQQAALATKTEQYLSASVVALPTLAEAAAVSAVVIAGTNIAAALLADTFMASVMQTLPLGVGRPEGDVVRIESALLDIATENPTDPLPRMARLARSEPIDSGRIATVQVLGRNKIRQYRWIPSGEVCDLCRYNAAHLWPISKLPVSHPSCSCLVMPVLPKEEK